MSNLTLLARFANPSIVLLSLALVACSSDDSPPATVEPDPLRIAVMMPTVMGDAGGLPELEWARENVNAAGGVAGRKLAFDYLLPDLMNLGPLAEQVASDDTYIAAIAPPGSSGLEVAASIFYDAKKPIVSPTSTSDDLLRAYGGKGTIWRTVESDIAQTELLVRFAEMNGSKRITLLTSLNISGYSFFSWFGFFASELGYPADDVHIVALKEMSPCEPSVMEALATTPDILFVAPGSPEEMTCIVKSLPPAGMPRPRIVFADTGFDPYSLTALGDTAQGIEGFAGSGEESFTTAFSEHFPDALMAPRGASEYDAVLLLAYGLEVSGGKGGKALNEGMKKAVDGTEDLGSSWDAEGIKTTLTALKAGKSPALKGATGPLVFEPDLYMDLASSTLSHWTIGADGLAFDGRYWTGDPSFLTSSGAFVKPGIDPKAVDQSTWTPASAKTDTWAVIAALSSSWSNYRHQSDAIQQYRMLRDGGVDDDHIVLILADDIATSPENELQGVVRNVPAGENLYVDVKIDYDLAVTTADLSNILTGNVTATTPEVIAPTASSNVYIYLAGHGGTEGIPLKAGTPEEGLSATGPVFSPKQLREALCALREQGRFRRVLTVIESCYSGAFGEVEYDGLERGCETANGDVPLEGVALLTAANSREVSYAGAFDDDVPAWVNDAFSRNFSSTALATPSITVADLYTDAYRGTAGSHPSIFNADHAGRLTLVPFAEFVTP